MTKMTIVKLQCRCMDLENSATTPAARRYWSRQFRNLTTLARKVGWID